MDEITDTIRVIESFDVEYGYPLITPSQQGRRGTRTLLINRRLDVNIINPANGIPQAGDPHPRDPGLICTDVIPSRSDRDGYWTPVRCEYVTRSGAPSDLVVEDGDSFHELIQNRTTVQIVTDRDGAALPVGPGGTVGTSRNASTAELVVTAIRSNPSARDVWIFQMADKVNRNPVAIPPMRNLPGTGFTAAPGQLLFKAVTIQEITARTGLIKLQYSMDFAADHKQRYKRLGPDNRPIPGAPIDERDIYEEIDFPAGVFW